MPKRTDLHKILLIGSGPIVIGQACEFDYSGTQACKALREEGYKVVLVNSNPATIMTDPEMADRTYIEPITWQVVAKIIEKERPDALLPTLGGQTGLNTAMDLYQHGVLAEVRRRDDRRQAPTSSTRPRTARSSRTRCSRSAWMCPRAAWHASLAEAQQIREQVGLPCVLRPSFTLGGTGGGIAYNREEFNELIAHGLELSPVREVLIEESVIGWKEYELEVMRDQADNVVIVCSIENLDPMGVHTGDSITVAPAQTLTDKEYQRMRDAALADHPRDRRRDRRQQHPVRRQSRHRPHDRHRDEPARQPLQRAGVEGDRLPHRQDRRQARGRLPARRAEERHHARDAGLLRADHRLRRHQGAALDVREIPRRRPDADHADEIGRRDDGDRPHVQGIAAKGAARPGNRALRPGLRPEGPLGHAAAAAACEAIQNRLATPNAERIWYIRYALKAGHDDRGDLPRTKIDPGFSINIQEIVGDGGPPARLPRVWRRPTPSCSGKPSSTASPTGSSPTSGTPTSAKSAAHRQGARHRAPVFKLVDTCAAEFEAYHAVLLLHLRAAGGGHQIRNPKSEIRNKSQIRNPKTGGRCRRFGTFGFWICFGFRYSDFGFGGEDETRPATRRQAIAS